MGVSTRVSTSSMSRAVTARGDKRQRRRAVDFQARRLRKSTLPRGVSSCKPSSPIRITAAPRGEVDAGVLTRERLATRTANLPSMVCSSPSDPTHTSSMGSAESTVNPPAEISTSRTGHADEAIFESGLLPRCRHGIAGRVSAIGFPVRGLVGEIPPPLVFLSTHVESPQRFGYQT